MKTIDKIFEKMENFRVRTEAWAEKSTVNKVLAYGALGGVTFGMGFVYLNPLYCVDLIVKSLN